MEDSEDTQVLDDMDPDGVMASPDFARVFKVKRAPFKPVADVVSDDGMKNKGSRSEKDEEHSSDEGEESEEGGEFDGDMELPPQEAEHREKAFRLLQLTVSW